MDKQKNPPRLIFRSSALERYKQRGEKPVTPNLAIPRSVLVLWFLLALLVETGLIVYLVRIF
jgi:hypothetical protein